MEALSIFSPCINGLLIEKGNPAMAERKAFQPQYVTNADGERTAVILPIDAYQELLEDIEDLAAVAERRKEPTVSHEELIADLKRDGIL